MPIQPVLLDIPDQLETPRLHLRAPRPGDGAIITPAINESLTSLRPWMDWAQQPQSVERTEANTRYAISRFQTREELRFLIFRQSDDGLVGVSGLQQIDWTIPRCEIGYWARTSQQGHGYITEAIIALTEFAFDTLDMARIEIRCDARNTRSAAVAARAGYMLEARLRHDRRDVYGQLADTLIYARIAEA